MELKDYNLYSLFIRTVELKNYSRVAEAVGLSSHHIVSDKMKMLEQRVGVKLFVRAFRSMEPTSDALVLYERVKKTLNELDTVADEIKEFNEHSEVIIRMGCPSHIGASILRKFFKNFKEQYPKVQIEFFPSIPKQSLLAKRELDFSIDMAEINDSNDPALEKIQLIPIDFTFFTSKNFFEENKLGEKMTLSELLNYPIILQSRYRNFLLNQCKLDLKSKFRPNVSEQIYEHILDGMGIGFEAEKVLDNRHFRDSIVRLKITDLAIPESSLLFVYCKGFLSKPAKTFLERLRSFLDTY